MAAQNEPKTFDTTVVAADAGYGDGSKGDGVAGWLPPQSTRTGLNRSTNLLYVVDGEHARAASDKREIGVISAAFLVFNRMVGTGIFATPSGILQLSGSVGLALFLWVAGSIIAAAGMAVYLEFGTAIPKNGGEKNYLEFVYKRPKFLATGMYTGYVMLLGESFVSSQHQDPSLTLL
jgi:hypothetical protein